MAGTLALVFFNRPTRVEIVCLAVPIAALLTYGFSDWIGKRRFSDLPPIFSPGIMRLSPGLSFRTWSL